MRRLTSATNPESGTVSYGYDLGGNLTSRFDARGYQTTMSYDGLNRIVAKNYSDSTPAVSYCYDGRVAYFGPCYGAPTGNYMKGRLTRVTSSASVTDYVSYDALVRRPSPSVYIVFLPGHGGLRSNQS